MAATWALNARAIALVLGYLAGSWWLGIVVMRWTLGYTPRPPAGWLLATGLGNGFAGIAALALGMAGLLHPVVLWAVTAGAVTAAAVRGRWWVSPRRRAWAASGLSGDVAILFDLPTAAGQPDAGNPPGAGDPSDARSVRGGAPRTAAGAGAPAAGHVAPPATGGLPAAAPGARWVERIPVWAAAALAAACLAGIGFVVVAYLRQASFRGREILTMSAAMAGGAVAWGFTADALGRYAWPRRIAAGALLGVAGFILLFNVLPAMEPEWFYDSLVYHLAVPEQWLIARKVCHLPHTFFSNFPFLEEMQFAILLGLGDDLAPKVLHWAQGSLAAVATYVLARIVLGPLSALLAACVFLSQPTLRFLQHVTMVELGMTWFQALAVLAFAGAMRWTAERRRPFAWMAVAGWLLGFAQGTKYIGIWASVLLLGWWGLAHLRDGRPPRRAVTGAGWLIAAASAGTLVWLGKNWLFTGDPFFPFLTQIFPALGWDGELYARWMRDNTKYGTGHGSWRAWLTMPAMASIDISDFGTFTLNPFAIVFLPCLLALPRVPEAVRFAGLYAAAAFVLWATSSQQTRFLYPMMPVASVAIAYGAARTGSGSWAIRGLVSGAAVWILAVGAFGEIHNRFSNNALTPYTTGHLSRLGLLRLGVQYYETVERAREVVSARDRVLFLGGDESFYLGRRRLCNSIYDRSTLGELAKRAASPADLVRRLRTLRITHLVVHEPRCDEYVSYRIFDWGEPAIRRFLDAWAMHGRLVFVSKGVFLFELTRDPIPPAERRRGRPGYFHPPEVFARSRALVTEADELFKGDPRDEGRLTERQRALEKCDELVRLMPEASHAWAYRGYASGLLRKNKQAIADYERAIELGYPTSVVYYNQGVLLEHEKQYARALRRFREALAIDPGMGGARERGFESAVAIRDWPAAIALGGPLLEAREADPLLRVAPETEDLRRRLTEIRRLAAGSGGTFR